MISYFDKIYNEGKLDEYFEDLSNEIKIHLGKVKFRNPEDDLNGYTEEEIDKFDDKN